MSNLIPSRDFTTLTITEFIELYNGKKLERALLERSIYFQYKNREKRDELAHLKRVIVHMQEKIKIPKLLKDIKGVNQFKYKNLDCVYFLMKGKRIVYIGQTTDLPSKIKFHRSDNVKNFDKIFYIIDKDRYYLNSVERQYIQKFKPKYNITNKW